MPALIQINAAGPGRAEVVCLIAAFDGRISTINLSIRADWHS